MGSDQVLTVADEAQRRITVGGWAGARARGCCPPLVTATFARRASARCLPGLAVPACW